jgi:hypothetical protein
LNPGKVHDFTGGAKVALDATPIARALACIPAEEGLDTGSLKFASRQKMDHAHETNTGESNSEHDYFLTQQVDMEGC